MPNHTWSLIAHGGAKDISPEDEKQNRDGLAIAIKAGSHILEKGGTALDAVEEVVKILEDDPSYNAGSRGSVKNADGEIELTASIMDGVTLDIGAVAAIQHIQNPVSVARMLLKEKAILLVGKGAEMFASMRGVPYPYITPYMPASSPGCDTVGCVARDICGNIAVATSTGGLTGVHAGRVGDVPLPGCGFYADNACGGISCSGEGETIARILLASEFLHLLKETSPDDAAKQAIALLDRVQGEAGLIAIDKQGEITWAHNSPHFAVGLARAGQSHPSIYLKKSEEHEITTTTI